MASRRGRENVGKETKFAIVHMSKKGIKQVAIAKHFSISKTTVSMILKNYKTVNIVPKKKREPKFKLNETAIRILKRIVLNNNRKPLYTSVSEFKQDYGYNICIKTVRKYIYKCGIRNYAAVSKPYRMPRHILNRKRWANMHKNWYVDKWAIVTLPEESTFTLKPITLRKRVWRKQGERYTTVNLVPNFKSGYQSISVWAAFSICGRTPLIRIKGNLKQHKYIEILQSNLLPFAQKYHGGTGKLIFQQDGCGPHRAKSVKAYLDAEGTMLLHWSAQSPDTNPIENTWAILKKNFRQGTTYPTSKAELFEKLSQVWGTLPSEYFERLIASMQRRVLELSKVRGLSTKY